MKIRMREIESISRAEKHTFQVYQITHEPSSMKYVGCVYAHRKTYIQRFVEHMTLNLTVSILSVAKNDVIDPSEFYVELLDDTAQSKAEVLRLEQYYISQIYPTYCLNVVGTPYKGGVPTADAIAELRDFDSRGFCKSAFVSRKEPTSLQNSVMTILFPSFNVKKKDNSLWQSLRTRVGSHKITKSDGWKQGRKSFSDRCARGEKTESEKRANIERKTAVKNEWESLSEEERKKKSRGLSFMNSPRTCEHCEKNTSESAYRKYHKEGKCLK